MYEFTDNVIRYLNREYIEIFSKLKSKVSRKRLARIDEVTILGEVEESFRTLEQITQPMLLQVANWAYHNYCPVGSLTEMWLTGFLDGYSPVTKYVFSQEVKRKKSRLYEALVATNGSVKEIDAALRYWSQMIAEYAVEVTDAATRAAFEDMDITEVEWFTEEDERVCSECGARHGKVYPLDKIPPKPHWGCRCYLLPHISE